jgi:hypothetical protein
MCAIGPFRHQRGFVADLDPAADPVAQFFLAGHADAAQDRTGHFGEVGLDPVEPRGVGWGENKFKAPGLGVKEAPSLPRAVIGVIIEQDADQHANPIGGVELLQEGDELAGAVALSDGMVDNASHEVDSGRKGHGCRTTTRMTGRDN